MKSSEISKVSDLSPPPATLLPEVTKLHLAEKPTNSDSPQQMEKRLSQMSLLSK
jgi:hypothetical protein